MRSNQKRWFEEALKRPVTVNYSRKQLAIMNREHARDLFMRLRFAELALAACRDLEKGSLFETFPWLQALSKKEKKEFREELLDCFARSTKNGRWNDMEDLISDWKATAEAKQHPEIPKNDKIRYNCQN